MFTKVANVFLIIPTKLLAQNRVFDSLSIQLISKKTYFSCLFCTTNKTTTLSLRHNVIEIVANE